jgi:hypothetical protein
MEALLDRLTSGQIVAVISILTGGIVALSMIWAIAKYQLQALAEDTALRRERQKADLALRELLVERRTAAGEKLDLDELHALAPSEPEGDNLDAELAKRFGMLDASPETIAQALSRAMTTGATNKKRVVAVMDELLEYGANSDAILAAVRPLCAAAKERPVPADCVA